MEAGKFSGSDEYPSIVGNFDENGLNVNNWNGNRNDNVGVGASRHFHSLETPSKKRVFHLSFFCGFNPPSKHFPNLVEIGFNDNVSFGSNCFHVFHKTNTDF